MPRPDDASSPQIAPPASPEMAARLAINRTGQLTTPQRRVALFAGLGALGVLLCPLAVLVQMAALILSDRLPSITPAGVLFTGLGVLFIVVFSALIGTNLQMFLPEALGQHPVRYARGPLQVRVPERERPELPFSYVIGDYSFAPYVAPPEVPMRVGAPYLVYYSARSRLLLSLAALDAPDAEQWEPQFEQPGAPPLSGPGA